ncbi:DUF3159 domain-containing protein [Mycobacterium sp. MYCO198283]|uniref:DUF3159 domain-containing protein n=1 Tax=Mycobacterium sp. MYCO198283 TaxID=2883505 RepID=UPI001E445B5D|nr:DUF3159 domain-containing protein [Mycobacterium sp. MYCO198283]MCG5433905.1 DUF3159 domain-containing protein [Mycobacterium sp. MYCO198283]
MTAGPSAAVVLEQLGGVRGLVYSSLPVIVFVPVSSVFGLTAAVAAALGVATVILLVRLLRRESVQPAVSGFVGVGIAALIAYLVGESKGYFLLGIWSSLLWAVVFGVSLVIRRPLVGYIWGWVSGHGDDWRRVRRARFAYDLATLTWVAIFAFRFVLQHYLYDADETGWLGVARIAQGVPLTAVGALVTFFAIQVARRAMPAAEPAVADGADHGADHDDDATEAQRRV